MAASSPAESPSSRPAGEEGVEDPAAAGDAPTKDFRCRSSFFHGGSSPAAPLGVAGEEPPPSGLLPWASPRSLGHQTSPAWKEAPPSTSARPPERRTPWQECSPRSLGTPPRRRPPGTPLQRRSCVSGGPSSMLAHLGQSPRLRPAPTRSLWWAPRRLRHEPPVASAFSPDLTSTRACPPRPSPPPPALRRCPPPPPSSALRPPQPGAPPLRRTCAFSGPSSSPGRRRRRTPSA